MHIIQDTIGRPAFERMCEVFGGTDYDIPTGLETERGQMLAEAIGDMPAKQLIKWGGGSSIYVPYDHERARAKRYAEILAMHRSGMSIEQISRDYRYEGRYCVRQTRAIVNGHVTAGNSEDFQQLALAL